MRATANLPDSAVARMLDSAAGLEYAVPAYLNTAAPTDTLVFLNRLLVEFSKDPSVHELGEFQKKFHVRLLARPERDAGLVNYAFRFPSGTRDPLRTIHSIEKDPSVRLVSPDMWNTGMRLFSAPNDSLYASQFNLNSSVTRLGLPVDVRAELAWTISLGAGIRVAVLDDGVWANHPDLSGRVSSTSITSTGDGDSAISPGYPAGHGTAVAGIIGATQGNGSGMSGLAPTSTIYAVKVFDLSGFSSSAFQVSGIDQSRTVLDAQVINGSWGSNTYDAAVAAAVSRARTLGRGGLGIAMAFETGNAGANTVAFPATETGVIAVGLIGPSGSRGDFSNGGPRLDVVAPGSQTGAFASQGPTAEYCLVADGVPATGVQGLPCSGPSLPSGYATFTGTSAAAPQVAAIAALVIARFPTITGTGVRDRIKPQADYWGAQNDFGSGCANAYLSLVGRVTASVNPPSLVQPGVATKTCSAQNGLGSYSYRWYLSYTNSSADLFDTGITSQSISQSISSGEAFLLRCVVSDGVQNATADRSIIAN